MRSGRNSTEELLAFLMGLVWLWETWMRADPRVYRPGLSVSAESHAVSRGCCVKALKGRSSQ